MKLLYVIFIQGYLSFHVINVFGYSSYGLTRFRRTVSNSKSVKRSSSGSHSGEPPRSPPPPPRNNNYNPFNYDDNNDDSERSEGKYAGLLTKILLDEEDDNDQEFSNLSSQLDLDERRNSNILIRGGSDDIVAGTKSTLQSTKSYWTDFFQSTQSKLHSLITNLNPFAKRDKTKTNTEDENEPDASTIPVQNIEAPGSTILPSAIIRSAGQRSGLIGSVMRTDRVQECAKIVKSWYMKRGYVLHTVTGATLHAENGTATLNVQEPRSADLPLDIRFAKLVPIDPETGETTTMRKYKTKLERKRGGRPFKGDEWDKIKSQLNTTLIETKGKTSPRKLSRRLGLQSGDHFKWDGRLWQSIARSGIFTKIWRAQPVQMSDGSVQLQVLAQESKSKNLEYGIQKSLYTGNWEGELDFKHENILGGGESLGVVVRRGAKDPVPSVKLQFIDNKFGMEGGYDAQLFSEYVAMEHPAVRSESNNNAEDIVEEVVEEVDPPPISSSATYDDDEILTRRGLKFNLRNPISANLIRSSTASTALERTSTRTGRHETIASGTLGVGPFVNNLPLGAKTSLTTTVTSGTRIGGDDDSTWRLFPYSKQTSIARQIFPVLTETLTNRGINLAFETVLMTSTKHLPRHEANAAGLAARVRGYSSSLNGPLGQSLSGTAELRIPVIIPFQKDRINQDGQVVLFGDWMFGIPKKDKIVAVHGAESGFHKSSCGVGLRKSIQGIPLKYDISVSKDGKLGAFFGLGHDWTID